MNRQHTVDSSLEPTVRALSQLSPPKPGDHRLAGEAIGSEGGDQRTTDGILFSKVSRKRAAVMAGFVKESSDEKLACEIQWDK